jgi:galactose mutarotase-like enzyme
MPYRQTLVSGLPAISLYNNTVELIAVPSAGARITHLRLRRRGREWLWHNPVLPFVVPPPDPGNSPSIYVDRFDSGGWDECFPTVGACALPGSSVDRWLPDHGELWHANWTHDLLGQGGATIWRSIARCRTVPAIFTRRVELADHSGDDAGTVTFHYSVRSTGSEPFPFLWSAHPLLTAQPGTRIELPGVSRVRVGSTLGRHDLTADGEIPWPLAGDNFFVMPPGEGWAAKLFAESPAAGRALITDPLRGETLELQWDGSAIPWIGLWINPGGFGPEGAPHYTLAVEPCLAAPDALDRAVRDWRVAPILRPGEERTWRLTVVLREAVS